MKLPGKAVGGVRSSTIAHKVDIKLTRMLSKLLRRKLSLESTLRIKRTQKLVGMERLLKVSR